ncbi:hypothetical protein [Streptomyces resistomycificus]|uniref:Uncharacterized protein n=1 Tax=Streptomyces resistomycificus TaxID=67356 RepID=A0A0L8L568_9ACTN|nr:hypothetical protein [Streptomyces resistomycificus]KOG33297.1 hypothetical protein ADK37_23235 [Streptomyces resistomycificus]KUN99500.1 hypothetical protein AQJ84_11170 [Streptomyces resistomycificus]
MPSLSTLVDNFNTGTLGPEWGNSYGGTAVVGGRARVPCTTAYAGCQTGYAWTLAGASFFVQVPTVPAASGATAEAYCAAMVQGTVEGTRVGFSINAVTGLIRFVSEVGYWDDDAVAITYDPVAHLFVRLTEDGTNLLWDTSPDGTAWTNRRTLATPAWIDADIDVCALDMSAHRDAGTGDFAEFDLFNTLSNGAVWTASATISAQAALGATALVAVIAAADLTAEGTLASVPVLSARAAAALTAESTLTADVASSEIPEVAELAAGDWDLYIEQGATFLQRFTVDDDPEFTWDGWEARSQIRSEASANGELLLDLTDYLTVDGAEISIAIPASVTETLTRNGRWDLEVVNGSTVVRLLNGRAIVSPEVTRS